MTGVTVVAYRAASSSGGVATTGGAADAAVIDTIGGMTGAVTGAETATETTVATDRGMSGAGGVEGRGAMTVMDGRRRGAGAGGRVTAG